MFNVALAVMNKPSEDLHHCDVLENHTVTFYFHDPSRRYGHQRGITTCIEHYLQHSLIPILEPNIWFFQSNDQFMIQHVFKGVNTYI